MPSPRLTLLQDPKRVAEAMAETAASYVMIAPEEERDSVLHECVVGFEEALADLGIAASAEDVVYYIDLMTAAVQDMTQREVKEPKLTRN